MSRTSLSVPSAPDLTALARCFSALRRSGLLSALSPAAWQVLSALFSLLSPDGRCTFSLAQLAYVLGCSEGEAGERLGELSQTTWNEGPLLGLDYGPGGEVVGARLSPVGLFAFSLPGEEAPSSGGPDEPIPLPVPPTSSSDLSSRLAALGLYPEQVERLLGDFPEERIRQQIELLPSRRAKNPAALFIKAVEGDWGPPKGLR
jgi:hypothetical protein